MCHSEPCHSARCTHRTSALTTPSRPARAIPTDFAGACVRCAHPCARGKCEGAKYFRWNLATLPNTKQ
jgi:hypothetical protein